MANRNRVELAFSRAKSDFERDLDDQDLLAQISQTTSIKQVYEAAQKIQEQQAKTGRLRHLRKIEPYLQRLRQFSSVVDTFVQAKPDILALIWGPIKLLLVLTSTLSQSFDAIRDIMFDIGNRLPLFESFSELFDTNDRILDVLCLFYQDVLDFHLTALRFFGTKRWKLVFESVWPRHKTKIDLIARNIEQHALLMTNEVQLVHIRDSYKARADALDHWERTREFQERQDFREVEVYLSPVLYESELFRLLHTVSGGTGSWLFRNKAISQWLDPADDLKRLIWLQGIPGAGKTHISAIIVDKAKTLSSKCLFAFISYKHKESQSAVALLHSLMFQLVSDARDLQMTLCKLFRAEKSSLKGSPRYAREALSRLLLCAGRTLIVVDGLDETEELERGVILHELLQILKDCPEAKLCVSSRLEHDLSKALKGAAEHIRVDHNNAGCIQAYVTKRMDQWLNDQGELHGSAHSEIQGLLAPLSAKANGMFLYARIVMDSVVMSISVDQIKEELHVLPESLEEAYSRIVNRLKLHPPSLLNRAQRLLGYLGCSITPLTLPEVEQLICLRPGEVIEPPRILTSLNVVQLCGPIVEVIENFVFFVHFTAKDYLFGRYSDFIDHKRCTFDLTSSCLNYLSSDIFESDIDDDEISQNILSGAYRLFGYAATQWFDLVCKSATMLQNDKHLNDLVCSIDGLMNQRENHSYRFLEEQHRTFLDFNIFKSKWPAVHESLMSVLNFHLSWADQDPLTLSSFSVRVFTKFEALLCPDPAHNSTCNCVILRKHYGSRLFKCKYSICHSQRVYFESRKLRDRHSKRHGRPFKCSIPTCSFAEIGFLTHSQLNDHWSRYHEIESRKRVQLLHEADKNEIQPLLFDLVTMRQVDEVRQLQDQYNQLPESVAYELLRLSAYLGPLELFRILDQRFESGGLVDSKATEESMIAAIKGENLDIMRHIGPRYHSELIKVPMGDAIWWPYTEAAKLSIASNSPEVFDHWMQNFAAATGSFTLMSDSIIREAKEQLQEQRLVLTWKRLYDDRLLSEKAMTTALNAVARTTCSVLLADTLLKWGANVKSRTKPSTYSERTALQIAITRDTLPAAEFIKCLLLSGVDPHATRKTKRRGSRVIALADEKGAQNISKWLGMTWDELIEWTRKERQREEILREERLKKENLSRRDLRKRDWRKRDERKREWRVRETRGRENGERETGERETGE